MSVGGAGRTYGPLPPDVEGPAPPPGPAGPGEAPVDRPGAPAGGRPDTTIGADLLRTRLESDAAPDRGRESFADRMARLHAGRSGLDVDDLPDSAARRGLGGALNKALVKLSNTDVNAAKIAERELTKLLAGAIKKARDSGMGDDAAAAKLGLLSDERIDAMSASLAGELRTARFAGVSIESLSQGTDLLVRDLGAALTEEMYFLESEREIRREAEKRGGLYPGEDVELNEKVGKPVGDRVEAARDQVSERLRVGYYFKPGAKIDVKKLDDSFAEALTEVRVDQGLTFRKGDFRAKIGAEVEIAGPLTRGAEATVRGYAEIGKGNFEAKVEGRVLVHDIYGDPRLGSTADVSMHLGYKDPRIKAMLDARATIPLQPGAPHSWSAGGSLGYNVNERTSITAGIGAQGGSGVPVGVTANVGMLVHF